MSELRNDGKVEVSASSFAFFSSQLALAKEACRLKNGISKI